MAFINCPRCHQFTSDRAASCRGCARRHSAGLAPAPTPDVTGPARRAGKVGLLLGLGVLVPAGFLGWSHRHPSSSTAAAHHGDRPALAPTAPQLARARPTVRRG